MPGLLLRVSATGGKVFYVTKRANDRIHRIKVGSYPILTLSDARDSARTILRDLELGKYSHSVSPGQRRMPTLGETIPRFIEMYAKQHTRDWRGSERLLNKFAKLQDRPIDSIKRADVVGVLDEIISTGAPTRANRALAALKKLMSWCVDRGVIELSPIAQLKMPTREVPRERVLTDDELRLCWAAAKDEGYPFAPCLHLLVLTGQRRGEVAGMRWSELDLENSVWTIPASRAKNGSAHIVPLPPAAIEILRSVPRFLNSEFVFTTTGRSSISGFGRLKRRIDASLERDTENWRIHDLRRTVATNLAMMRVPPHIIEAVLNHKSGIVSGVAAVYNRHAYLDEKREALQLWATKVEKMTTSTSSANIAEETLAAFLAS